MKSTLKTNHNHTPKHPLLLGQEDPMPKVGRPFRDSDSQQHVHMSSLWR